MFHNFFKILAFVALIMRNSFGFAYGISGVIWSSDRNDFIPIESIPAFRDARQDFEIKSYQLKTRGSPNGTLNIGFLVGLSLFEIGEDGKPTGVIGEMLNVLAEYLHFTMVPIELSHLGHKLPNGSYDGALGMLMRGEVQMISGMALSYESSNVAYAVPFCRSRFSLYTRPATKSSTPAIVGLFSSTIWCLIILVFLLMSVVGYGVQRTAVKASRDGNVAENLHDHLFYTFSMFCCQGSIPDSLYRHTNIISFTKAMFAFLILTIASSQLVSNTANQKIDPAFQDLKTMFTTTDYNIVLKRNGAGSVKLQESFGDFLANERYSSRIIDKDSLSDRYKEVCFGKKMSALFVQNIIYEYSSGKECKLVETGISYFSTWYGAALLKSSDLKESIDIGILKMMEFGLANRVKNSWTLLSHSTEESSTAMMKVDLHQVEVPFAIVIIGFITSIVVSIVEQIVHIHQSSRR